MKRLRNVIQSMIDEAVAKAFASDQFKRTVRAAIRNECAICGESYEEHERYGPPHMFEPYGTGQE